MTRFIRGRFCLVFAACLGGVAGVQRASAQSLLFDWEVTAPGTPGVIAAPFLSDANAAQVAPSLTNGSIRAIKINSPLSDTGPALQVLRNNGIRINHVFADFTGATGATQAQTLRNQLLTTRASSAFFGNNTFLAGQGGTTMSNLSLYPDTILASTPNIRSGMFLQPILEMQNTGANDIPYVARFNNWGTTDARINNNPGGTYGTTTYQYAFDTSISGADQLLSRADFRAMVQHEKLRGADGLHLFEPGVIGYTKAEMQADATAGWNLMTAPTQGNVVSNDADAAAGSYYSAVRDGTKTLKVLFSNLGNSIIGLDGALMDLLAAGEQFNFNGSDAALAGEHYLLEFSFVRGSKATKNRPAVPDQWVLGGGVAQLFTDPLLESRNGVGVPEPTTAVVAGFGAILLLARRRRGRTG